MRRRRYLSKSIGGRRETGSPVIAASRWFGECLKRPSIGGAAGVRWRWRGTLRRRHPRRVIRRADGENFSPNLPRERISVGRRCRNPRNARYPNPCRRPAGQGSSCVRTWDRSNHRLPKDAPALALVCGLPARPTIVNLQLNVLAPHRQRTVAPNAVLHVKRGRESRVKPENPTPAIGLKCSRSPRTRRKSVRDGKNGRPVRRQQPPKR